MLIIMRLISYIKSSKVLMVLFGSLALIGVVILINYISKTGERTDGKAAIKRLESAELEITKYLGTPYDTENYYPGCLYDSKTERTNCVFNKTLVYTNKADLKSTLNMTDKYLLSTGWGRDNSSNQYDDFMQKFPNIAFYENEFQYNKSWGDKDICGYLSFSSVPSISGPVTIKEKEVAISKLAKAKTTYTRIFLSHVNNYNPEC